MVSTRERSKAQASGISKLYTGTPAMSAPSAPRALPKAIKTTAKKITKKASTTKSSTPSNRLKSKTDAALNAKKPKSAPKSPTSRCLAGGPNGPKVYDDLGFELSYEKCASIMLGGFRRRGVKYHDMWEQRDREEARKREIMGTKRENVSALSSMAWNDRVARELGIPYHKVEMEHFEELARRGFVAKEGEFEAVNMSEEERDRLTRLATGSAFRA